MKVKVVVAARPELTVDHIYPAEYAGILDGGGFLFKLPLKSIVNCSL